ncbi:hypothetical protein Busp01_28070 [Trinickia caryophylli]|nr:hypothetical protein Busp01_28070 [Trinickia caryophylli]
MRTIVPAPGAAAGIDARVPPLGLPFVLKLLSTFILRNPSIKGTVSRWGLARRRRQATRDTKVGPAIRHEKERVNQRYGRKNVRGGRVRGLAARRIGTKSRASQASTGSKDG